MSDIIMIRHFDDADKLSKKKYSFHALFFNEIFGIIFLKEILLFFLRLDPMSDIIMIRHFDDADKLSKTHGVI